VRDARKSKNHNEIHWFGALISKTKAASLNKCIWSSITSIPPLQTLYFAPYVLIVSRDWQGFWWDRKHRQTRHLCATWHELLRKVLWEISCCTVLWSSQNFGISFRATFITFCGKQIFQFPSLNLRKCLPWFFQAAPSRFGEVGCHRLSHQLTLVENGWHLPYAQIEANLAPGTPQCLNKALYSQIKPITDLWTP